MLQKIRQRKIAEILEAANEWLDRSAIAKGLKKKRLNDFDIEQLESLVTKRLVERDKRKTGITEKFVYRTIKEEK